MTLHPNSRTRVGVAADSMARVRVGFIIPFNPRRAPEGSALGVPHRTALDATFEWRLVYFSTLLIVSINQYRKYNVNSALSFLSFQS